MSSDVLSFVPWFGVWRKASEKLQVGTLATSMLPPEGYPKQGTPRANPRSHDSMMWPELRARIDTIGCFMFEEIQILSTNPLEALAARRRPRQPRG